MKSKYLIILILLAFCLSCSKEKNSYSNFTGFAQGTTYRIVFQNSTVRDPGELRTEVENILKDFDKSLSLYKDSSVLSRINRNEEIEPDSFFTEAFLKSKEMSQITGGSFDITVGPLVKAWGFGPDSHKNFSESKRDSLIQLVGMDKVDLVNGKIVKSDPRLILDFNAIAQGYSVDVIYNYLKGLGYKNFLVEIGGEIRVRGDKNGAMWKVGIDRPFDDNMTPGADMQAIIRLKDQSLATSGNYRKFYIENGVKYSHTIDPKTGYPAKNQLLSATIIASDCAAADAVATACMVMGKDKTIEFLDLHKEFQGYLIYSDDKGQFRTWESKNLRKYISE